MAPIAFLSLLLAIASCSGAAAERERGPPARVLPRLDIIGGNNTNISLHPYQVSIWSKGDNSYRGSGALVGKRWVATPASIIIGYDAKSLRLRAFSTSASSGGVLFGVTKVLVHPKFNFNNMTYDVAMLRIDRPSLMQNKTSTGLHFKNIPFNKSSRKLPWIPIARGPLPDNCTANFSGWGSTSMSSKMSDSLLQTSVKTVDKDQCQQAYLDLNRELSYSQFCAIAVNVYGPCWGDNGGLVVYKGKLFGLLSWNKGCYNDVVPSVFTYMPSVRPWILRVMKKFKHV